MQDPRTPAVSLIVVNLDGRAHLEAFMPTVAAQTVPGLEVIVVDNGSSDGSVAWLGQHHPQVRVVANDRNHGFARANNQGVAVASAPYVLLVNNDMRLEPDFVEQLLATRRRLGPAVACVGARILNWDGTHADFVDAGMNFEGKGFQLDHGVPADSEKGRGAERPILFACGGAMLVDRAVYLEAGGLDEAFFAYYEDVDFGWRLWVLGYQVVLCPAAVCLHRHNGTSARFDKYRKDVLLERNAMYAMLKNYDDASLAATWPAALLLAVKRLAVRSTLDRRDWAFELAKPAPAAAGLKQRVKQQLVRLGEFLVRRYGLDPRVGPRVPIAPEAYASAVAIEDLIDHLPALLAERRRIQAARRRPDREIFPLFKLPFHAVEGLGHYPETQTMLLESLGVLTHLDGTRSCATSS